MKYRTIVADPPWPFQWGGGKGGRRRRATELGYPTMSVDEICEFPVAELADPDGCHLYLWVTDEINRNGEGVLNNVPSVQTWNQPRGKHNGGKQHSRKPDGFPSRTERGERTLLGKREPRNRGDGRMNENDGRAIVDRLRGGWVPMADMERRDAMAAWHYRYTGIRADFYVPGAETSAFDLDWTLVRRAPFWKRLVGIPWEYRDNPDGNSLREYLQKRKAARL